MYDEKCASQQYQIEEISKHQDCVIICNELVAIGCLQLQWTDKERSRVGF